MGANSCHFPKVEKEVTVLAFDPEGVISSSEQAQSTNNSMNIIEFFIFQLFTMTEIIYG
jgi:hypothetical protein